MITVTLPMTEATVVKFCTRVGMTIYHLVDVVGITFLLIFWGNKW